MVFVKTRHRCQTPFLFSVVLEREEGNGGTGNPHGYEMVGWLAVEAGRHSFGGVVFEARSSPGVTHDPLAVSFGQPFADTPYFFGTIASYAGHDAAQVLADTTLPF